MRLGNWVATVVLSAVIGAASAGGIGYAIMDEDTDVDSRIEAAVAAERERSDKTTKDLVRLVSGILKQRLIPLEKRSYRITDEALWPA